MYRKQLPSLWDGLSGNHLVVKILAFGRINHFDLLTHLTDDFYRKMVAHFEIDGGEKPLELEQWADPQNHLHFYKMRNVKVPMRGVARRESILSTSPRSIAYNHLVIMYVLYYYV